MLWLFKPFLHWMYRVPSLTTQRLWFSFSALMRAGVVLLLEQVKVVLMQIPPPATGGWNTSGEITVHSCQNDIDFARNFSNSPFETCSTTMCWSKRRSFVISHHTSDLSHSKIIEVRVNSGSKIWWQRNYWVIQQDYVKKAMHKIYYININKKSSIKSMI